MLKAAGFDTGTRVDVRVMQGCIVLTAQTPQPEESALNEIAAQSRKAVSTQTKTGAGVYRGDCGENVEGVRVSLRRLWRLY